MLIITSTYNILKLWKYDLLAKPLITYQGPEMTFILKNYICIYVYKL